MCLGYSLSPPSPCLVIVRELLTPPSCHCARTAGLHQKPHKPQASTLLHVWIPSFSFSFIQHPLLTPSAQCCEGDINISSPDSLPFTSPPCNVWKVKEGRRIIQKSEFSSTFHNTFYEHSRRRINPQVSFGNKSACALGHGTKQRLPC